MTLSERDNWICPALGTHWQLGKHKNSEQFFLKAILQGDAIAGSEYLPLSPPEAHALRHFNGKFTVRQVKQAVQKQFPDVDPNLLPNLLDKLIEANILTYENVEETTFAPASALKEGVEWRYNPDGYWVLRNPIDRTYMQLSDVHKAIIDRLGRQSPRELALQYDISLGELQDLMQKLTSTGMLEGTTPPTPPKQKFNPLKLLFFQLSLFNPDTWLTRYVESLRWIWTQFFGLGLCLFLGTNLAIALHYQPELVYQGQQLMQAYGASLFLPFGILAISVVAFHELGHAFTLKHYGGEVPDVGLLFMCLFPAAYTNTTDSYCLPRRQRILVIVAGIIVQVTFAAIAFTFWGLAANGTWLQTASLLLMAASLFTVAVNLNPLARFDGYYLAVAVTGINNLRSRAFNFYRNLLTGQPLRESPSDRLILAAYAPFSLVYLWCVFGFLFWRILDWTLLNIPMTALVLLGLWAIYFYFPRQQ
ncbi:MAG: site-2 protease family protein [Cyanobacteria bacterium P01_E01_bin.42]